ncbi:hypothetical protein GF389_05305 [Candidatus Dojkabacteria bacterium]|nr:hypothetical protein [Candidatus Dojkabacteria bacterium]
MKLSQRSQKRIIVFITLVSLTISLVFAGLSINPATEADIAQFINDNPIISRILIVALNTLSIVVWPISMALVNLVAIKYMPWGEIALYSIAGNIIGYIWAFQITKRFRGYFKRLFSSFKTMDEFEDNLNGNERFSGLILIRIAFQGFSDYTSYFLGITNINFRLFLITTIIAEILIKVPRYYLVYLGINVNPVYFSGVFLLILVGYFIYRRKFRL